MDSVSAEQIAQATAVLLLAVIIAVTNWINSKSVKKNVSNVQTTLTEKNGGSTVRDQLDRIEARQKEAESSLERIKNRQLMSDTRLERIEQNQDRQDAKIDKVDQKINNHLMKGK